jgi:hypothetical protein
VVRSKIESNEHQTNRDHCWYSRANGRRHCACPSLEVWYLANRGGQQYRPASSIVAIFRHDHGGLVQHSSRNHDDHLVNRDELPPLHWYRPTPATLFPVD